MNLGTSCNYILLEPDAQIYENQYLNLRRIFLNLEKLLLGSKSAPISFCWYVLIILLGGALVKIEQNSIMCGFVHEAHHQHYWKSGHAQISREIRAHEPHL
jgi:hypothetical protein